MSQETTTLIQVKNIMFLTLNIILHFKTRVKNLGYQIFASSLMTGQSDHTKIKCMSDERRTALMLTSVLTTGKHYR